MKNWKFLKQPEFWTTTAISIVLAFAGGFLTSNYTNQINKNSSGNIITQGQDGNNLIENNLSVNEYPKPILEYEILSLNIKQNDGLYATNVKIKYRSVPGVPLTPFKRSGQFRSCEQQDEASGALMPVNNIEFWTTAYYLCQSNNLIIDDGKLFTIGQ